MSGDATLAEGVLVEDDRVDEVTCVYEGALLHARVEHRAELPSGGEVFYTDAIRNGTRLGFRVDLRGKRWISGRHAFDSAEAQALLVASADPTLPPPEFWIGHGEAQKRFDTRDGALAAAVAESWGDPFMSAMADFEAAWHDRLGGDATNDLRFVIGVAMAQLTGKHGVHPRALADYLREALRLHAPDAFDRPS